MLSFASCELLPLRFDAAHGELYSDCSQGRHERSLETMYNQAWELLSSFLKPNNVLKLKESS